MNEEEEDKNDNKMLGKKDDVKGQEKGKDNLALLDEAYENPTEALLSSAVEPLTKKFQPSINAAAAVGQLIPSGVKTVALAPMNAVLSHLPSFSTVVTFPFKVAGKAFKWSFNAVTNSTFVKNSQVMILNGLKSGVTSVDNLTKDNEIKTLTTRLIKDFMTFFGSIIEEVGVDATNEFMDIFFKMLLNMGMKLISGIVRTTMDLLMSLIGEIPVAGGIVDLIVMVVNSFNSIIGSITPLILSSAKMISSGFNVFNSVSSRFMNNPVTGNIMTNLSLFNAKVFGGISFFGFISKMFGTMFSIMKSLFTNSTNVVDKAVIANAGETFKGLEKEASATDAEVTDASATDAKVTDASAKAEKDAPAINGGKGVKKHTRKYKRLGLKKKRRGGKSRKNEKKKRNSRKYY